MAHDKEVYMLQLSENDKITLKMQQNRPNILWVKLVIDQKEVHRKSCSKDVKERIEAANQFVSNHNELPNKRQMWADLTRLARNKDRSVCGIVVPFIVEQISKKIVSEDADERFIALVLLRNVTFSIFPNKQKMWDCLVELVDDSQDFISYDASSVLSSAFDQVPDKQLAWKNLVGLKNVQHSYARYEVVAVLISSFSQIKDEQQKQKACQDICEFIESHDIITKRAVANSLGDVFTNVPDEQKKQVWDILHTFTKEKDVYIRRAAAKSLGAAFSSIPNKQEAWRDLSRLASANEDSIDVKKMAAISLGLAFSLIPDKEEAYKILIEMSKHDSKDIKVAANYSLGRVHIFKASQADNKKDRGNELKDAIRFFEVVTEDSNYNWINPSRFCLPFYRPYYTIVYDRQEIDKERIDRDLSALKTIIERSMNSKKISKSKNRMLKILEDINVLVTGMEDRDNSKNPDYDVNGEIFGKLKQCCNNITDLIVQIESDVPTAAKIIKEDMKPYRIDIKKIQKEARLLCEEAKGTTLEKPACSVYDTVQKLDVENGEKKTEIFLDTIISELKPIIKQISKAQSINTSKSEEKISIAEEYEKFLNFVSDVRTVGEKLEMFSDFMAYMRTEMAYMRTEMSSMRTELDNIKRMLEETFTDLTETSDKIQNKKEGKALKKLVTRVRRLKDQGDGKAENSLKEFSLKFDSEKNSIIHAIENSDISEKEKVDGIASVRNFSCKNIQNELTNRFNKLTKSMEPIGKEFAQHLTVSLLVEIILDSLRPIISTAIHGAPVVSLIVNMLLEATK